MKRPEHDMTGNEDQRHCHRDIDHDAAKANAERMRRALKFRDQYKAGIAAGQKVLEENLERLRQGQVESAIIPRAKR